MELRVFFKTKLTGNTDARLALLPPRREDVKDTAVTSLVLGPQPIDADGAAVATRGGELHVGVLMADVHGVPLLVRQQELAAPVEPAHLPHGVVRRDADVTAEQQGEPHRRGEAGGSHDLA